MQCHHSGCSSLLGAERLGNVYAYLQISPWLILKMLFYDNDLQTEENLLHPWKAAVLHSSNPL